jgi:hypoxanthine phosphoribosyltransferase
VVSTGATLEEVKQDWDYAQKGIRWGDCVKFASLLCRESSKVKPDYYAEEITKDTWPMFPWEE